MLNFKTIIKTLFSTFVDELNRLLLLLNGLLFLFSIFIKSFYLDLITVLLFFLILYRLFSKNKEQRKKENHLYLRGKKKLLHPFLLKKEKDSVYKRCPKCKTILKLPLPKKRGILHAKCPTCQNRVTFFSLKKQKKEKIKVEVIKKKG